MNTIAKPQVKSLSDSLTVPSSITTPFTLNVILQKGDNFHRYKRHLFPNVTKN